MKYTINPDIYYGRYGEYTYVRNVRDRMDYLYNEICYDVLEALSVKGGRTPEQLAEYLYTVCEADSMDQGDFMDTLRSDMEEFFEELAGERIVAAEELGERRAGAEPPDRPREEVEYASKAVRRLDGSAQVSLFDIATKSMCGNGTAVQTTVSHSSPISPPPFMVGMAEVEVDKETGAVKVLNYTAVVDCGTPINPNLARVQTEGGIVQGIGMALFEDVTYNREGRIREDSLMRYKIPTRLDMGSLQVEFESSYEQTGPFGAKSIGEIVINTPAPAIAHAVYRATGLRHHSLPITPEKVLLGRDE